ncbi:hypothetical protein ACM66B_004381 [Microbotryomycetes sp. NB124-2]
MAAPGNELKPKSLEVLWLSKCYRDMLDIEGSATRYFEELGKQGLKEPRELICVAYSAAAPATVFVTDNGHTRLSFTRVRKQFSRLVTSIDRACLGDRRKEELLKHLHGELEEAQARYEASRKAPHENSSKTFTLAKDVYPLLAGMWEFMAETRSRLDLVALWRAELKWQASTLAKIVERDLPSIQNSGQLESLRNGLREQIKRVITTSDLTLQTVPLFKNVFTSKLEGIIQAHEHLGHTLGAHHVIRLNGCEATLITHLKHFPDQKSNDQRKTFSEVGLNLFEQYCRTLDVKPAASLAARQFYPVARKSFQRLWN